MTVVRPLPEVLRSRAWEDRQHRQLRELAAITIDRQESRIEALERENTELTAERDFLQEIIDGRPAINQALPQSYVRWSQSLYSSDVVLAHFRRAKEPKE